MLKCGSCGVREEAEELAAMATYKCRLCGAVNEITNLRIGEWLGFNYREYLAQILIFVKNDRFDLLRAKDHDELRDGRLSTRQIKRLKAVLNNNFERGGTMKNLMTDITSEVKPRTLKIRRDGELVMKIPPLARSLAIARTETVRAANAGAQAHYKDKGIKQYGWVASFSERTCAQCEALNGTIYDIGGGPLPPLHTKCRCSTRPITRLE